jgi:F-type H+-transporting ATPase subunit epsilon
VIARTQLQLILVTPETTLLDEPVSALRFPLYDGQIGVLPGRAPMIGRLGFGELHFTRGGGDHGEYFIDGGFVQVKEGEVSILTNRALKPDQIDVNQATELLRQAVARVAKSDAEAAARFRDQERARQMLAMASRR